MSEQAKLRPFHETIVDLIRIVPPTHLGSLACLIKNTIIPKNHDAIITAWRDVHPGNGYFFGVTQHLREQKRIAEEKAGNEKSINLFALQQEATVLKNLVDNPRPEEYLWRRRVLLRLKSLRELSSDANVIV